MDYPHRKLLWKRRDWFCLLVILVIATIFRLIAVQYNHYREDEAELSYLAQKIVVERDIPFFGLQSSVAIPNSPVTAYFMVPPYLFSTSPLAAVVYVALWNVVGVAALWLLAHHAFNATVAHLAALLYAVSPWAIWFSSKIWAQEFHTPFILIGFLLAWIGFVEGKRLAQIASLPILFIGFQMHFAAWALLPLILFFIWIGRTRTTRLTLSIGLILAVVTLLPFLWGLSQSKSNDSGRIAGMITRVTSNMAHPTLQGLSSVSLLAVGLDLDSFVGEENWRDLDRVFPYPLWIAGLLGVLTVLGFIVVWRFGSISGIFTYLWFLLPVLMFTPAWISSPLYYFVASIPICCLIQATALDWLRCRIKRIPWATALLATSLLITLMTQSLWWQEILKYIDSKPSIAQGTPLHLMLQFRRELNPDSDVLLTADSQEGYFGYKVWQAFLFGANACLRPAIIPTGGIILPNHPFVALQVPGSEHASVSNFFTSPNVTINPLRPGEGTFTVFSFDKAPAWHGVQLVPLNVKFDNGIRLIGYGIQNGKVYLQWELSQRPVQDYQFFIHVLDASGNRIGQRDTTLYKWQYLCANDQLITWTNLPIGPQAVGLHVGMYRLLPQGGYQNSNVINPSGDTLGQWVAILPYAQF